MTSTETLSVKVGNSSMQEVISSGNYTLPNKDVTIQNFKFNSDSPAVIEVFLINFGKQAFSKEVLEYIRSLGLKPAGINELLAVGAQYPEVQKEFPIVALGDIATIDGDKFVPYIDMYYSIRRLGLYWYNYDWYPFCRFLCVKGE